MEASGGAWEWEKWFRRMEGGTARDLYEVGVITVQDEDGVLFTCGMQQFDLPDAEVSDVEPAEAVRWLDTFHIWQLEESPILASGHSFRPDGEAERRVIERWPDPRHASSDGRQNPYGLWRFLPPGETGIEAGATVPFLMPSLAATLMALEGRSERPLTREQVEAIVEKAPAIAMEPADALVMERSRGYADIEPERAWEQWQIIRGWS